MKKTLLSLFALLGMALTVNAESEVFLFDLLGNLNGVADNGQYAVVTNEDDGYAYLWQATAPKDLLDISEIPLPSGSNDQICIGTTAMDVSDDGMVVGSLKYKDNYQYPAYYKDYEWHILPLDPNHLYTNEAVAVTPDGSVIGGYQFIFDPSADQGGRYFPCQWFRQEDGEYELRTYTNIKLPDHQGFFPMTQTPDGKVLGGKVYCGVGSHINALIKDGELIIFEEIETRYEPWIYRGKYYCGKDENGKQIWSEDPDDPSIILFPEEYISGYHDGRTGDASFLTGVFTNCDWEGNFYGAHTRIENLDDEGNADIYTDACIYNYLSDTWYTEEGVSFFSAGIGEELIFTGDGEVIENDNISSVSEAYGIDSKIADTDYIIKGIDRISYDGKTLGGVMAELNPATLQEDPFPFIVLIDGGTSNGIQQIVGNPKKALVIASKGRIEVIGADKVAVFDLNGRLMGRQNITSVPEGIYVVKADDAAYKIRVR